MTQRWAGMLPAAGLGFLLSCALALDPTAVRAAEPGSMPDSALATVLDSLSGSPLTLTDAVRLSLQNATSVRSAEARRRAAAGALRSASGAFDPELFLDYEKASSRVPTPSAFAGGATAETKTTRGDAGGRITLPLGTQVELNVASTRSETTPISISNSVSPVYSALGTVTVTQPLLKGFGAGTSGPRTAARRLYEAAEADFESALLGTRALAAETYWDLYAAERDYAVQWLNRNRSSAFLDQTRIRARAGLASPADVASAQAFLAEQDQVLLDLEENLEATSNRMSTLTGTRPREGSRFHPTDSPPTDFTAPPADSVLEWAGARSREVRMAESNYEAARALAKGARWNALPQLDVFGSLGGNGLAGTGHEVQFGGSTIPAPPISGGFGEALSQVTDRRYPTWSAGVTVTLPLFLRPGRGQRDLLDAQADQAEQRLIAARRALDETVRLSHVALLRSGQRLAAANSGLDAAREQVRIGNLEYTAGRTTAFELVRLRADLAAAERRYSQALVRAAKASAELGRFTTDVITEP